MVFVFCNLGAKNAAASAASIGIRQNRAVTAGGRVLCVTSLGEDIAQARQRAYETCRRISWDGVFYRKDIGWRALRRARD